MMKNKQTKRKLVCRTDQDTYTYFRDVVLSQSFTLYSSKILLKGIMPNIVWRAGRVAATIRYNLLLNS